MFNPIQIHGLERQYIRHYLAMWAWLVFTLICGAGALACAIGGLYQGFLEQFEMVAGYVVLGGLAFGAGIFFLLEFFDALAKWLTVDQKLKAHYFDLYQKSPSGGQ